MRGGRRATPARAQAAELLAVLVVALPEELSDELLDVLDELPEPDDELSLAAAPSLPLEPPLLLEDSLAVVLPEPFAPLEPWELDRESLR